VFNVRIEGDTDANLFYTDATNDRIGVGTISPSVKFQVNGVASTNGSTRFLAKFTDTSAVALGNGGGIMFQGVYTGTTAVDSCGIQAYKENVTDGNYAYAMTFATRANGGDLTERVRITSAGAFLVGTDDASGTVGAGFKVLSGRPVTVNAASTDATTVYEAYSTGASAYRFYVGMGGTIFATSIVITAISDDRLKENVRDIDTGLNSIMALKPRRFDWKEGKGQDKKNVAGFIAQEFETVFPECVSTSKAGEDGIEYKNINHETLIPTLVKAIQEQQDLITILTARVSQLESKA